MPKLLGGVYRFILRRVFDNIR